MRRPWEPEELQRLLADYATTPTAKLAKELGRTERAVYASAHLLGLRKSADYMETQQPGRFDGLSGSGTRFSKGQTPHNKGLRRPGWGPGRMKETQFKRGELSGVAKLKYQPIGTLRTTKDGYLERKVTDDPSIYPARRWVALHRIVWEAAHGPIPAGHVVVFRQGMRTAEERLVTIDRLELVSRAELMKRNSYHNNYPKELCLVIQLRGALNRKINARASK